MFKKLFAICIIILTGFFGVAGFASAHVLKTDGPMGVVLHIDPNDTPVASQPSTLIFTLKDTRADFKLSQCACQFAISAGGTQQYSQALTSVVAEDTAVVPYTFPQPAVYTLAITGKPINGGSFASFNLNWDWRVEPSNGTAAASATTKAPGFWQEHWLHVLLIALALFGNVFFFLRGRKKSKHKPVKNSTALVVIIISSSLFAHSMAHPDLGKLTNSGGEHPCCTVTVANENTLSADVAVAQAYFQLHDYESTASSFIPAPKINNKSPPIFP